MPPGGPKDTDNRVNTGRIEKGGANPKPAAKKPAAKPAQKIGNKGSAKPSSTPKKKGK